MLVGHNLIYLGPEPWEGLWRNRHWLMTLFARQNRVLYVEPERHLRPTLAAWKSRQLSLAPWRWRSLTDVQDGLHVYHPPPFAPVTGLPLARAATAALRRGSLRAAARKLGLWQPIVWISRPSVAALAPVFDARLTIYHVVDEYSAYPGTDERKRARLQAAEQALLRTVDLVIVSSRALLEAKRPSHPRTYLVPNAVNLDGYRQHLEGGAPLPPDLAALPRPRLGYVGLIGARLNFDLLEAVARAHPAGSLVLVGAVTMPHASERWERLTALPNVHYLGQVPAARVPEYVGGFDVGLLPYALGNHTHYIDPLKLYDYLAADKPAASVDLPALEGYRQVVYVGNTPDEFVAAVQAALD
jgi:hypothetical protein